MNLKIQWYGSNPSSVIPLPLELNRNKFVDEAIKCLGFASAIERINNTSPRGVRWVLPVSLGHTNLEVSS